MVVVLVVLAVMGGGAVAYAAHAISHASGPLPARGQMAALNNPGTVVADAARPTAFAGLPADVAPAAGATHRLLAANGITIYAWAHGSSGVCSQDNHGNGGCLSAFGQPISYIIADPDTLRSGAPVYVTGIVRDDVRSVDVIVNGAAAPARIQNNALYYELRDSTRGPDAIQAFHVTLSDGSHVTLAHDGALPSSLAK